MRRRARASQGFSLVEVLVALGVATVSMLALLSAIGGFQKAERSTAQNQDWVEFRQAILQVFGNPRVCTDTVTELFNPVYDPALDYFTGPFTLRGYSAVVTASDRATRTASANGTFAFGRIVPEDGPVPGRPPGTFAKYVNVRRVRDADPFRLYQATLNFRGAKRNFNGMAAARGILNPQTLGGDSLALQLPVALLTQRLPSDANREVLTACGTQLDFDTLFRCQAMNANNLGDPHLSAETGNWASVDDTLVAQLRKVIGEAGVCGLRDAANPTQIRFGTANPIVVRDTCGELTAVPASAGNNYGTYRIAQLYLDPAVVTGNTGVSTLRMEVRRGSALLYDTTQAVAQVAITGTWSAGNTIVTPTSCGLATGATKAWNQMVPHNSGACPAIPGPTDRCYDTPYTNGNSYDIQVAVTVRTNAFRNSFLYYRPNAASAWFTFSEHETDPPGGHNQGRGEFYLTVPPGGQYRVKPDGALLHWYEYY